MKKVVLPFLSAGSNSVLTHLEDGDDDDDDDDEDDMEEEEMFLDPGYPGTFQH